MVGKVKKDKTMLSQVLGALLKLEKKALLSKNSYCNRSQVFKLCLSQNVALGRLNCALSLQKTDAGKFSLKSSSELDSSC